MGPYIHELLWDEANVAHIARHGVQMEEAEEVLLNRPYVRRTRQRRYLAYGVSDGGRHLLVIFAFKAPGKARVITARPMDGREIRGYRRARRR